MSNTFKRFAFDREFAADGTVLRDGETIKRVLTEAEARAMAETAARDARRSAESEAAREAADALKQVSGKLQALIARLDQESEALRQDAARLALAAARAVAGAALDQYGAETVEQCVKEALADLRAEPRIAVRVAPHLADPLAERLYQYAAAEGFDGAVVVRADTEVSAGDCVIEWRSGAVERTAAEIETRIQTAVESWLARPAEDRDAPGEAGGGAAA
ncbi:MAG: FliH/SctL family protein [Oceanicaulis sp.]